MSDELKGFVEKNLGNYFWIFVLLSAVFLTAIKSFENLFSDHSERRAVLLAIFLAAGLVWYGSKNEPKTKLRHWVLGSIIAGALLLLCADFVVQKAFRQSLIVNRTQFHADTPQFSLSEALPYENKVILSGGVHLQPRITSKIHVGSGFKKIYIKDCVVEVIDFKSHSVQARIEQTKTVTRGFQDDIVFYVDVGIDKREYSPTLVGRAGDGMNFEPFQRDVIVNEDDDWVQLSVYPKFKTPGIYKLRLTAKTTDYQNDYDVILGKEPIEICVIEASRSVRTVPHIENQEHYVPNALGPISPAAPTILVPPSSRR